MKISVRRLDQERLEPRDLEDVDLYSWDKPPPRVFREIATIVIDLPANDDADPGELMSQEAAKLGANAVITGAKPPIAPALERPGRKVAQGTAIAYKLTP